MAVNNNFYLTMNELMKRATNGQIAAVVDYDSFIDAGKSLLDLGIDDLVNGFLSPLMNKVQKTIHDEPSYEGQYVSMYKGTGINYGVLEIIMGDFYDVEKSVFDGADTLVDGETYTDQFKVSKPKDGAVRYYTNSDSYSRSVTIRDTDLRGAFQSPEAMDNFIRKIFLDVDNSLKFAREQGRLNTINAVIKETLGSNEVSDDETKAGQHYHILTIYNTKMGTTLTADDALYNNDFNRFVESAMLDIGNLMSKPSKVFNTLGEITTFTPADKLDIKINAVFEAGIKRSRIDAYHNDVVKLGNYEVVPYWQNIGDRLRITTNTEAESETTYSAPILGILMDNRACGEFLQMEEASTQRNPKRHYTNYFFDTSVMLFTNMNANTVVFTLD